MVWLRLYSSWPIGLVLQRQHIPTSLESKRVENGMDDMKHHTRLSYEAGVAPRHCQRVGRRPQAVDMA